MRSAGKGITGIKGRGRFLASVVYALQKSKSAAFYRVKAGDAGKARAGVFTLYDLLDNCFSLSAERKRLAAGVLERLKAGPASFAELRSELEANKSTLYLLLEALRQSGLVQGGGRGKRFTLSQGFSECLESSASWWRDWVKR